MSRVEWSAWVTFVSLVCAGCAGDSSSKDYAQAVREAEATGDAASSGGEDGPGDPRTRVKGDPTAARSAGTAAKDVERGQASYYADSLAGNPTASGEPYDPKKRTAAHRELPFGTRVRVVREDEDRSVVVRINDRGPNGNRKRIIDLSRAAAEELEMIQAGVIDVRLEVLD